MKANRLNYQLQKSLSPRAIRQGLTLAIPFLIMGSFALLLNNFPNDAYQNFLATCLNGAFSQILSTLYNISLGSLSLLLCFTISLSYGRLAEAEDFILYPLTAISAYLAFCGGISNHGEYIFSAEWVFTAMCITLLCCILFRKLTRSSSRFERLHTTGADYLFNLSIRSLLPVVAVILLAATLGYFLRTVFGGNNITNFGSFLFLQLFDGLSGNLFGMLLYVLISHVLWFFGIHGTNTLEAVSQRLFEPNVNLNQALLLAGQAPTEIFSKTFLDIFVFLGGCGCALSLVIALCLRAKKSHNRKLALVALPSAFFNISEIVVFGFPIIFNFTMLIPFLLTPLVLTLVSTLATSLGLVPVVTQSVEWTVPLVLSGYKATGSFAGSLLQLVNVAIGVLIYLPFIKWSEKKQTAEFQQAARHMEQAMEAGEKSGILPDYLHSGYPYQHYAQTLALDLKNALQRNQIQLFYQAQISAQGTLHGAEALLRWQHPVVGYIAPAVIIHLAYESGILDDLGYYLLQKACDDAKKIEPSLAAPIYWSINISPKQLGQPDFLQNTLRIIEQSQLQKVCPVLEITERTVIEISQQLIEKIETLKNHGIEFSMDDFGTGHSSILNLQETLFDEVKLDGQLVSQLLNNTRSQEIVTGLVQLAGTLHYRIVAEFVETPEQQKMLQQLGCTIYQGYYYCKPLPLDKFMAYLQTLPSADPS